MSLGDPFGAVGVKNSFRDRRTVLLAFLVVTGCVLTPAVFLPNWDVAWYFEMSQRLIDGERLYADTVEVNFPLAVYAYLPAVWFSNLVGGSPFVWLGFGAAVLVLLNLWIADRVLDVTADNGDLRWWILQLGIALTLIVFPTFKYGQREHLAVLMTLPYLLARLSGNSSLDEGGRSHLVPLGLIAGIGFALKPFFFLPWFVTQIVVTGRNWSLRNVLLVALTALPMVIQLLAIPTLFPDLVRLYQVFGQEYAAFGRVEPRLVFLENLYLPAAALVLLASARLIDPTRRLLVQGLTWTSIAWFAAGVIQAKGWSYHFLPAHMTLILGGGIAALSFARSRRDRAVHALLITSIVLLGVAGIWRGRVRLEYPSRASRLPAEVRAMPRGMRALNLSVRMDSAYPLLNELDARQIGAFPMLWPLEVEYRQSGQSGRLISVSRRESMDRPESVLFESVVRDLVDQQPDLILVTIGNDPSFNDGQFDYLSYFSQDESFREELEHYVTGPTLEHIQFYVREQAGR